ncbi:MAG: Rpn family recombination-promoting nuclease/putative transposase [Spirochaetaceae bacterium]|nr:Rpn family recombination-promoting nuclease/putative transposase [Spirochaetaceae bacterium]
MENRNYKDSVFVDLFAKDITAKNNFISLYNALHESNLDPTTTTVDPVMLEKVLYMKYYNDIAMLIDNKIVVMAEHQSTVNENMPFRMLEYIARVYEKLIESKNKFGKTLVKIPIPEFYVFYNGEDDFPLEKTLRLSDAFVLPDKKYFCNNNFPLEITVKVININISKHNPVLIKCKALEEYSKLVELVRLNIKNKINKPITSAIKKAMKAGLLKNYLPRKSTEVENMLLTEYDYDTDIAVQRQEAFEQGISQGISQGVLKNKLETAKKLLDMSLTIQDVVKITGLSVKEIKEIEQE